MNTTGKDEMRTTDYGEISASFKPDVDPVVFPLFEGHPPHTEHVEPRYPHYCYSDIRSRDRRNRKQPQLTCEHVKVRDAEVEGREHECERECESVRTETSLQVQLRVGNSDPVSDYLVRPNRPGPWPMKFTFHLGMPL